MKSYLLQSYLLPSYLWTSFLIYNLPDGQVTLWYPTFYYLLPFFPTYLMTYDLWQVTFFTAYLMTSYLLSKFTWKIPDLLPIYLLDFLTFYQVAFSRLVLHLHIILYIWLNMAWSKINYVNNVTNILCPKLYWQCI